jgi:ATP-dependent protease HslVU (ClpYQ) peptidase subunit
MTAISAIQKNGTSFLITDKLGTIGSFKEPNMKKVFYGDNYIIAFAGHLTVGFINYITNNINNIAANSITPQDMINECKKHLETENPKSIEGISCICIKNGVMSYAKYSLASFIFEQQNNFIGIGSGGSELATALSVAFDGQDIENLSENDIRTQAEKAMRYVSSAKSGVGTDVLIYKQTKNTTIETNETAFSTVEFSDNVQENRKKISAIIASSGICYDGYELSPSLLIEMSNKINKSPITMRLIPDGSMYHNNDEIIGEWVNAATTKLGDITLLKSRGYVDRQLVIGKNLSASILCKPTEISLRKDIDGKYIKSVINAELIDISITRNPLDKLCAVLEASCEFNADFNDDDIIINQCTINFTDNDFDNLLNKNMNADFTKEDLGADTNQVNNDIVEYTNDTQDNISTDENLEKTADVENTQINETTKITEEDKEYKQKIENENSQLKNQIKDYEDVIEKLLEQNIAKDNDIKDYDSILGNEQILEELLKNKK